MPSVDDADTELETAKWVTQWTLSSPGKFGKFLAKHSLRPEGLYLSTKRLTGLALMNIHTDLEIDSEEVLKQFDATGRRAMRFGCNPLFARVCECACVSLAFYLSPLNNVTYKHIGLAETNKQTNKQPKRQHAFLDRWTDAIHAQSTVVVIGSGEEVKRKGLYHH